LWHHIGRNAVSPVTRSRVTRRVLNALCLKLATSASENDNGSPLSPSIRRREKCRVFAHWPNVVCYPVSERQFCCRLCYERSCRLNLNTGFHAPPNNNARSIQRPSNHSRRTTQNPRISIPQVRITYRPPSGDWYVVYCITWLATKVGLSRVEFVTETSVIFASLRDHKNSQREQDSQLSVFSFSCAVNDSLMPFQRA
jgi:hypothetical protein